MLTGRLVLGGTMGNVVLGSAFVVATPSIAASSWDARLLMVPVILPKDFSPDVRLLQKDSL